MASFSSPSLFSRQAQRGGLKRKKGRQALATSEEVYDLDQYRNEIPDEHQYNQHVETSDHVSRFDTWKTQPSEQSEPAVSSENGLNSHNDIQKTRMLGEDPLHDDYIKVHANQGVWTTFLWPALAICLPISLLSTGLLYIVFNYQVRPGVNIFASGAERPNADDHRYLLVNFSATKLVFLASFLSTLAPLLGGCTMSLVAILVYQEMQQFSNVAHFPQLPTPYQTSLLIGLLAASYEQFFSSFKYLLSTRRTVKASPVLVYALSIFALTVVLGIAVTITDAYLHVATTTVSVVLYKELTANRLEAGKGINSLCLDVDRVTANYGYPCTYAATNELGSAPEWQDGQPEMQRLAHNTSTKSSIEFATMNGTNLPRIAYLAQFPSLIPDQTNYQATTIGVATQCSLIPPTMCNTTRWGDGGQYTSFNCSLNFYGALGLPPAEAPIGKGNALSPYISFLAINQNANLIYNYFADENLDTVYNSADLNATAQHGVNYTAWPDSDLVNPVFLGLAWRTATSTFAGFSKNGMISSGAIVRYANMSSYVQYFVNCAVTSYNVTYTLVNGTLSGLEATKQSNGSALNMWAGLADYKPSISGSDFNLQDYNVQSAIAGNSTQSYETKFGELISQDALSTIGAFTSGRSAIRQQDQKLMLVAKVPKAALGALLACALLYPVLGLILLAKAAKASRRTGPMTPLFSYWGLTWAAFVDNRQGNNAKGVQEDGRPRDKEEALRLFVRNDAESGSRFGLYRRSHAGHVTEIERSQTNVAAWI